MPRRCADEDASPVAGTTALVFVSLALSAARLVAMTKRAAPFSSRTVRVSTHALGFDTLRRLPQIPASCSLRERGGRRPRSHLNQRRSPIWHLGEVPGQTQRPPQHNFARLAWLVIYWPTTRSEQLRFREQISYKTKRRNGCYGTDFHRSINRAGPDCSRRR